MGEGLQRAFAAARNTQEKAEERDLIEATFRDWWHLDTRHGMGAWEAGASLMKRLDAAGLKIGKPPL